MGPVAQRRLTTCDELTRRHRIGTMARRARERLFGAAILAAALLSVRRGRAQQDLGHKIPGTLGLDAGVQAPSGVYVANRILVYGADSLVDRWGDRVPARVEI